MIRKRPLVKKKNGPNNPDKFVARQGDKQGYFSLLDNHAYFMYNYTAKIVRKILRGANLNES
jgi:hypothetical protein